MTVKVTLSLNEDVVKNAKAYAAKNKRSLSNMIENYLKGVTNKELEVDNQNTEEAIDPLIKKLSGIIKLPKDFDYKKEVAKRKNTKYNAL